MRKILLAIFILFGSAGLYAQTIPQEALQAFTQARIQVLEKTFPVSDFSLPLLDGKTQSLNGLKGKVVFLNFWATWCPPCRAEMPDMEKLYRRFKNEGLEFLAVNIQEHKTEVEAFMQEYGLSFPVALDSKGEIAAMYGIRGIPTTYIIGRDGRIIAAAIGERQWYSSDMINAFRILLQ